MTDGTKHNHHTVPKFYLRGFSKKEKHEKVNVVNLAKGTQTEQRIGTASVIPDFYSVRTEEFQDLDIAEDHFENWLSEEFERPTGLVFKKINEGIWPLDPDDRVTLAKFITLQYLRSNNYRIILDDLQTIFTYAVLIANGRENLGAALPHHFKEEYIEGALDENYTEESLDRIWSEIADGVFRVKNHQHTYLEGIIQGVPLAAQSILERPWFLIKFSRKTLITSDNPVVLTPDCEGKRTLGSAPEICFPLNRTTVIIMASPMDSNDARDGKYDIVAGGNTRMHKRLINAITHNDAEYLYCHPDDREQLPPNLPRPRQRRNFENASKKFLAKPGSVLNTKNTAYDDMLAILKVNDENEVKKAGCA